MAGTIGIWGGQGKSRRHSNLVDQVARDVTEKPEGSRLASLTSLKGTSALEQLRSSRSRENRRVFERSGADPGEIEKTREMLRRERVI